jgi:hypothetical protein
MADKYQKYKPGLDYLKKSGLDLVVEQDFVIKSIFTFKEHTYFGETKENLPKPYKVSNNVLSTKFMEHYDFITKVDLARFLRVVSVILTKFTGPKENDHFDNHIYRLQDLFKKQSPENEALVMEALQAYNEVLGSKKSFPKEDYISFARILDHLWNIFKPKIGKDTADELYSDYYDYDDYEEEEYDPAARLADTMDWVYKELFKDFKDAKLLKMIKDDTQRNTLMLALKQKKLGDFTDDQLKQLINKKKDREELIKKINKWYTKKYPN